MLTDEQIAKQVEITVERLGAAEEALAADGLLELAGAVARGRLAIRMLWTKLHPPSPADTPPEEPPAP